MAAHPSSLSDATTATDRGTVWDSPEELLRQTGMWELTQQTCEAYMQVGTAHGVIWAMESYGGGVGGARGPHSFACSSIRVQLR